MISDKTIYLLEKDLLYLKLVFVNYVAKYTFFNHLKRYVSVTLQNLCSTRRSLNLRYSNSDCWILMEKIYPPTTPWLRLFAKFQRVVEIVTNIKNWFIEENLSFYRKNSKKMTDNGTDRIDQKIMTLSHLLQFIVVGEN